MKPIKVNPIEGMASFLATMVLDNPYPDQQITDKIDNIIVDTSLPKDTMIFETGINRDGKWVIVEQYHDDIEAITGHDKWVSIMREYPDYPLKDIDQWGIYD
jgi:hypothetical protein